ncbi:flagellar biosynthetic protein FliO [Vibrio sp. 10N.261.46.E12]|uniref:flagellar biosynthetic protein FliO n=1 Tax=unclassified Vibrio TaxID=2614977 RepID=UPI000975B503|nr:MULTISPECIES: flagellar biosynthetic protein FliO [unclassified Vibrio]OMO37274.1 flagellar biosynthetic protein FliO [Vibrio sp. 10N.261.45.E1]PMJ35387.1 flagellar biosynthetic protein FliO [Vibrio sp. 10N.286.45.B6]PML97897.1 flagellar biosynthetic protein FliO [Vibrio sp. 10N.261.49.E11]PMM74862.1 flagellar biosynthetic protein FliO [Vibrio sp. 10N.261.46.F12]PMM87691.1 flagellar biosynthetic protein FliO [Vibrio sp. 10N.261.46.E8]
MSFLPQRLAGSSLGMTGLLRVILGVGLLTVPSIAFAATPPSLDLATTFGSLIFVIAFILFIAWLLKRMQVPAMSNQQGLAIVRQIPVGTKERIAIVQAGDEQFLVGITTQSIQLISKLDKPLTQEMLEKSTFSSQLSQLIKKDANK